LAEAAKQRLSAAATGQTLLTTKAVLAGELAAQSAAAAAVRAGAESIQTSRLASHEHTDIRSRRPRHPKFPKPKKVTHQGALIGSRLVGDWRVIFYEERGTIVVAAVGHRREIY
jgi:mRNA-degrading endonuclease RelE of RelBE toxin-antitoxin system